MAKKFICVNCENRINPLRKLRGNVLITFILLLCAIVPGLIYMVWRRTGKISTCPKCGSENPVPINSPAGKRLISGG